MDLTFNGKTQSIPRWAEETGISASAIFSRKERGWSDERTLTEPVFSNDTKITKNDCEMYLNSVKWEDKSDSPTMKLLKLAPVTVLKRGQYLRRYNQKEFDKYFSEVYKPKKKNEQKQ